MTRDQILSALSTRRTALEAEGATSLYIYGSRARGDHRVDSDLDVFIDYDPSKKFSLLDLAGIKLMIEDALGLVCHVTTRSSLSPRISPEIERHAIRVF